MSSGAAALDRLWRSRRVLCSGPRSLVSSSWPGPRYAGDRVEYNAVRKTKGGTGKGERVTARGEFGVEGAQVIGAGIRRSRVMATAGTAREPA